MQPRTAVAAPKTTTSVVDDFLPHVAAVLWATGGVLGIGSLLDLGILWIGQDEHTPQWEFMAVSNTLNAMPTLVLALGIAYLAVTLTRSSSVAGYRILAGLFFVLGMVSAGLGAILLTDYFALAQVLTPESRRLLWSTTLKGVLLSSVFFALLVPIGLWGVLRRGRR